MKMRIALCAAMALAAVFPIAFAILRTAANQ